jgi:Holliday junction DNA helicase RuvA
MIAYLSGKIRKRLEKGIILDTGNVGYLVQLPAPLLEKAAEKSDAEFYIYTKVREDDISLYGFETVGELDFFKTLLNVNGIGPKLGLEILSQNPEKVKAALMSGDLLFLTKIPGIGKKTAERLLLELRDKLDARGTAENVANAASAGSDVMHALLALGYNEKEAGWAVKQLDPSLPVGEAIRQCLKLLSKA